MRILIYGFGPYLQFDENVTAKIVRGLPRGRGLKKLVFPVRFHKGQFIAALRESKPDVVLGLGQCPGGRFLRQERRAVNRRRASRGTRKLRIAAGSPAELPTSLRLDLGGNSKWSRDAGIYVCNFSMYVILDYIRRRKLPIRYGFIHVPHDYPYRTALNAIRRALNAAIS
jgi:pyroglutamyl-peptidase